MNLFYASFIPGLQDFIAVVIKERLCGVKIHKLLDGAVIFETETSYDKLNFFCFNNIFAVINVLEEDRDEIPSEKFIRMHIQAAANTENRRVIADNNKKIRTFRIVISSENKPSSINEKSRMEAEDFISRVSGLKVNRALPDAEFWFLYRNEERFKGRNFSCFMKRLTLRPSWEKTLQKGELPPPLAWTLCRLANLAHADTVLDPFCGYGSIPNAAFRHFHITKFIACEKSREAALFSAERFNKRKNGQFTLHQCDFFSMMSLAEEKSIDAIVTDPPWGHFRSKDDDVKIEKSAFLKKMFEAFERLLKEGGRAVLLYDNDDEFTKAVPASYKQEERIPILLSGKKAVIYKYRLVT